MELYEAGKSNIVIFSVSSDWLFVCQPRGEGGGHKRDEH